MIRQSFQNIVNPKNIIENFDATQNYYEDIQNDTTLPSLSIDNILSDYDKCSRNEITIADYGAIREKNFQRYKTQYDILSDNNTDNETEKHKKIESLMKKLVENIKESVKQNEELEQLNLKNEQSIRENNKLIEINRNNKKKDKNFNLVTNANVIGTKETKNKIRIQYIIFLVLIFIFLIIQLVIFFV